MSNTAYDEVYFDSVIQKTRYLFKLIARNTEEPFQVIKEYMCCTYRSYMDMGNPLYLNKTPKQILGSMGILIEIEFEISEKYDECILEWMADVYTYLQWKYNLSSEKIVKKIEPENLYQKYSPLHEASLSNCAEKLRKVYLIGEETHF